MSPPARPSAPRWGIRVASDRRAGAGHLSRCRAIAAHLPGSPRLFLDPEPAPADVAALSETTVHGLEAMIDHAERGEINAALIDSYAIAEAHIDRLTERVFTIVLSDDGAARGDAAIAVPGLAPAGRLTVCAGPQFAPLAEAYAAAHDSALKREPSAPRAPHLLIAFGARDSVNCTATALDAVGRLATPVQVTAILGVAAPHLDAIAAHISRMPAVRLLVEPTDMIPIYADSDLAIGAPGISFLERLCCGLPSLLLCQNATQQTIAAAAIDRRLAAMPATDDPAAIAATLDALLSDATTLGNLRRAGLEAVDGRGARRLADALESARHQRAIH